MKEFCQGDIIKITDYQKQSFVIISKNARSCSKVDSLKYDDIINISDCIQGLFEYN